MFRTTGWRCCRPVMKSSGGEKGKKGCFFFLQKAITHCCLLQKKLSINFRFLTLKWLHYCVLGSEVCLGGYKYLTFFLLFGLVRALWFLYGSSVVFWRKCLSNPVQLFSTQTSSLSYIGSDIPGDKRPCSVLWLCKNVCACATFCPGVNSRLSYLMKFPLQVSLFIVSELGMTIGDFWNVACWSLHLYPAESSVFKV